MQVAKCAQDPHWTWLTSGRGTGTRIEAQQQYRAQQRQQVDVGASGLCMLELPDDIAGLLGVLFPKCPPTLFNRLDQPLITCGTTACDRHPLSSRPIQECPVRPRPTSSELWSPSHALESEGSTIFPVMAPRLNLRLLPSRPDILFHFEALA
jgi:hypothetical protein